MSAVPWVRSGVVGALATAVLVTISVVAPEQRALAIRVYVLLVAALALRLLVLALVRADPSPRALPLRQPARQASHVPVELARIGARLTISTISAMELYYGARPLLRELAAHRLAVRRGIRMDAEPERAREALGEAAWTLLRPDLPVPADRLGPGLSLPRLAEIVGALEAL